MQVWPAVWKLNWSVGSLGRPAQRGAHCENWHVDAFMPLSRCSQGALEECHNAFFSLSGACPCHTLGCRSQTAFPSCHLSPVLWSHATVIQVTSVQALLWGGYMLCCVVLMPQKQQQAFFVTLNASTCVQNIFVFNSIRPTAWMWLWWKKPAGSHNKKHKQAPALDGFQPRTSLQENSPFLSQSKG